MSIFRVGQKVVCVDDAFAWKNTIYAGQVTLPTLHAIYTIRAVDEYERGVILAFKEVHNTPKVLKAYGNSTMREPMFLAYHFRPVVNTDISIFTAMLKQVTQRADA